MTAHAPAEEHVPPRKFERENMKDPARHQPTFHVMKKTIVVFHRRVSPRTWLSARQELGQQYFEMNDCRSLRSTAAPVPDAQTASFEDEGGDRRHVMDRVRVWMHVKVKVRVKVRATISSRTKIESRRIFASRTSVSIVYCRIAS